jgi:hypothetical protein
MDRNRQDQDQLLPEIVGAIIVAGPIEVGREAHLNGKVAAALMAKAGELLAKPPAIHKIDILTDKLPK